MSSFVQDVLVVEDGKEKTDLTEKIEIIKKEIIKLKAVINDFMKEKYVELEPFIKPDEMLIDKCEKLVNDIKILQTRIDDQVKVKLSSSLTELQNLTFELREHAYSLNLSNQLLEIYKNFEAIENYKDNKEKQNSAMAVTLIKLHSLIIENNKDIQRLNIYLSLKEEYYKLNDKFNEDIIELWHGKIRWDQESDPVNVNSISLSVQCDLDELKDIVEALHCINRLTKCIDSLSAKLLQHFINPIILCDCVAKTTDKTFSIDIIHKKQPPTYKTVLNNLQLLFKFLHENFNVTINNEHFFFQLSIPLLPGFSSTLTNNCISNIIPTSTSELEMFKSTVSEIDEFQNYLVEIKFINEDQKFLSKYTENIDNLYIDKKCEKLLEMARNIMKKDLHDSFRYKPENTEEFIDSEGLIEENDRIIDRKLTKNIFLLPECQISKSVQEILNLVEEILTEACNTSEKYVLRLFYSTRNIFEMYAAVVPEIHKSFLETIPQQVALFHNNCFYIAHYLLTLAYKYNDKMPSLSQDFSMIYTDQAFLLRQVGSEYFLNHMKYQRDIIFSILRESGLSSIGQMPELPATTERALRQCIRQLELLKTVWIEILPIQVYCRALGCIVNDMADDLCSKVVNVEDIPADVASELVTLFNMVVKRIPQIFPNPALIEHHVHKWRRLKELIILLGASLKQIEDRWADGKGPLANEFSPQHVKQLIRALFQNTERRSNLLSKIKEKS